MRTPGLVPASRRAPGFGMIAIAGDIAGVDRIVAIAREHPAHVFALMLRDPSHRSDHVARLARHLLAGSLPANLVPIANAHPMPGIPWVHLTSAQLAEEHGMAVGVPFGASAHTVGQGLAAARLGARYVTLSPIFPTGSKPGHPGVGLDTLRAFCAAVPLPVFALGGIDVPGVPDCIAAGARGIASISLFASGSAPDIPMLAAMIERGEEPSTSIVQETPRG